MLQTPAPYATRAKDSRGRLYLEAESRRRSCFQRDRDRIIHSTAFRRLKHKTQVFIAPLGDHFRTRLTHSLEVAQIARSMARSLGLDEDLTEALALAHDFGHPPFGHAGEMALDEVMVPFGGFDHNEQTLRILVSLEQRYPGFDGLNLTWETLEGVVKHNGPFLVDRHTVPSSILNYCEKQDLELQTYPGPEAQIAAIADDIAYDNHDIDDGLRAGTFSKDDLVEVSHVADIFARVRHEYPNAEEGRITSEAVRRMIGEMVEDILFETERRIAAEKPQSAAEVRGLNIPIVAFSEAMARKDDTLKQFLFRHMYRHRDVMREVDKAKRVIQDLFNHFLANVDDLPAEWRRQAKDEDETKFARVITDYIAGMTDNYALKCHEGIFRVDTKI